MTEIAIIQDVSLFINFITLTKQAVISIQVSSMELELREKSDNMICGFWSPMHIKEVFKHLYSCEESVEVLIMLLRMILKENCSLAESILYAWGITLRESD